MERLHDNDAKETNFLDGLLREYREHSWSASHSRLLAEGILEQRRARLRRRRVLFSLGSAVILVLISFLSTQLWHTAHVPMSPRSASFSVGQPLPNEVSVRATPVVSQPAKFVQARRAVNKESLIIIKRAIFIADTLRLNILMPRCDSVFLSLRKATGELACPSWSVRPKPDTSDPSRVVVDSFWGVDLPAGSYFLQIRAASERTECPLRLGGDGEWCLTPKFYSDNCDRDSAVRAIFGDAYKVADFMREVIPYAATHNIIEWRASLNGQLGLPIIDDTLLQMAFVDSDSVSSWLWRHVMLPIVDSTGNIVRSNGQFTYTYANVRRWYLFAFSPVPQPGNWDVHVLREQDNSHWLLLGSWGSHPPQLPPLTQRILAIRKPVTAPLKGKE
jgi:hypothetical protein